MVHCGSTIWLHFCVPTIPYHWRRQDTHFLKVINVIFLRATTCIDCWDDQRDKETGRPIQVCQSFCCEHVQNSSRTLKAKVGLRTRILELTNSEYILLRLHEIPDWYVLSLFFGDGRLFYSLGVACMLFPLLFALYVFINQMKGKNSQHDISLGSLINWDLIMRNSTTRHLHFQPYNQYRYLCKQCRSRWDGS